MANDYIFVRNFINKGNKRIIQEIDSEFQRLITQARAAGSRIREDFNTGPIEIFRCWLEENAERFQIINHKTICNDNNNKGQSFPINVTVRYRRKDSVQATVMNYVIQEKTPEEKTKNDKFAPWR